MMRILRFRWNAGDILVETQSGRFGRKTMYKGMYTTKYGFVWFNLRSKELADTLDHEMLERVRNAYFGAETSGDEKEWRTL